MPVYGSGRVRRLHDLVAGLFRIEAEAFFKQLLEPDEAEGVDDYFGVVTNRTLDRLKGHAFCDDLGDLVVGYHCFSWPAPSHKPSTYSDVRLCVDAARLAWPPIPVNESGFHQD
jgi:hypothetical protein